MKKVMCPWCGGEIAILPYPDGGFYLAHAPNRECPIELDDWGLMLGKTVYETEDAAYAAATRRPPNKPLTEEQLLQLDDLDAVWVLGAMGLFVGSGHYAKWYPAQGDIKKGVLVFSAQPTSADIESARNQ